MKIAWAPFAHPSAPIGYGVIAKHLRRALQGAGAEMLPSTAFGWDCAIAVSLPAAWPIARRTRPDLVWHTMFEMTSLPSGWATVLNKCGLVWVPSKWCQDLFQNEGVTVPIMVSGYGVDTDIFYAMDRTKRTGPMKFLAWGQGMIGRKNIIMAMRAFRAASLPVNKAQLEVKVNSGYGHPAIKDAEGQAIPNIRVVDGNWAESTLADWLRSGDALIYLSAGEGFGLMPLEAMATGLPVICAANTGMLDYLTIDNALLVPSESVELSIGYSKRFGQNLYQEVPSFDAAVEWIRWVFEHREAARAIGKRAAKMAACKTWERAGQMALDQLEYYYG